MTPAYVNKILPFSSVDGPGNRTAIFLQSCNFACLYCHNPETINFCTNCGECVDFCKFEALKFENNKVIYNQDNCTNCDECIKNCPFSSSPKVKMYFLDDIIKEIEKTKNFISGITVSGGECTQQFDFLKELFIEAKKITKSVFIDTNAHLEFEKMKELSKYFDKAMIDLKWFDDATHKKLTGKSNKLALKNTDFLLSANKVHEIRTVVFPHIGNNFENIKQTAEFIAERNADVIYKLIAYRSNGVKNAENFEIPANKMILELKKIAENGGCRNVIIN